MCIRDREQGVRVAAGIALAIALMPRGAELAAAGAAGGGSIGPIIGIIVLVIIYAANRKRIAADIAADTQDVYKRQLQKTLDFLLENAEKAEPAE